MILDLFPQHHFWVVQYDLPFQLQISAIDAFLQERQKRACCSAARVGAPARPCPRFGLKRDVQDAVCKSATSSICARAARMQSKHHSSTQLFSAAFPTT